MNKIVTDKQIEFLNEALKYCELQATQYIGTIYDHDIESEAEYIKQIEDIHALQDTIENVFMSTVSIQTVLQTLHVFGKCIMSDITYVDFITVIIHMLKSWDCTKSYNEADMIKAVHEAYMVMTDSVKTDVWDNIVNDYCSKDAVGNRPCDNGVLCDTCRQDNIQELYREELKKHNINI